jgi:hypothetical protein
VLRAGEEQNNKKRDDLHRQPPFKWLYFYFLLITIYKDLKLCDFYRGIIGKGVIF